MDGVVEGQRQIAHLEYSERVKPQDEQFFSSLRFIRLAGAFTALVGGFFLMSAILIFILRSRTEGRIARAWKQLEQSIDKLDLSGVEDGERREVVDKYLKARQEARDLLRRQAPRLLRILTGLSIVTSPLPPLVFGLLFSGYGIYILLATQQLGPPFGF